jgi:hypothetical protein
MNNNRGNEINLSANIESIRAKEGAFKGLEDQLIKVMTTIIKAQEVQQAAKETVEHALGDVSKADQKQADKDSRKDSYARGSAAAGEVSNAIHSILKNTFSIIQSVYQRLLSASPLLQSIESLFNLAVQLFFMPLGTKLATEMLPAVMQLVDSVMQIWEGFEGKSLGDIFKETIEMGAEIFGEYFNNLGDQLADEEGLLGAIGQTLQFVGNLISNNGAKVLTEITKILTFIMENLPTLIGILVSFKVAQLALATANLIANLTVAGAVAAITGGLAAVVAGTAVAGTVSAVYAADGGYFPAKTGGTHAVLAEGGEGEYVVPESKKKDFAESVMDSYQPKQGISNASINSSSGAPTYITVNVQGYTDTDLGDKIKRVLNEQTNLSRLRSGF